MKRRGLAALVGCICMAAVTAAQAEFQLGGSDIDAGHFSIGGRGMYYDPTDAEDGDWSGGAQVRLHMSPALALEGSIDYRRSDFAATETHIYPVQASLMAYLMPERRITPYLLGGGGWYYTTVEGPSNFEDTQHRFGPHVGGGIQAFLNKHWSIDASYRYVWVEDIQSHDASLLEKDYEDDGSMVTAALNLHF